MSLGDSVGIYKQYPGKSLFLVVDNFPATKEDSPYELRLSGAKQRREADKESRGFSFPFHLHPTSS